MDHFSVPDTNYLLTNNVILYSKSKNMIHHWKFNNRGEIGHLRWHSVMLDYIQSQSYTPVKLKPNDRAFLPFVF